MIQLPHVNVEETFDEIVREYGGGAIVLREALPTRSPNFANADYVFHSEKVIGELKCLMDDNVGSPNNQAKINAAIERFYSKGTIKEKEITEENWRGLPVELQNEIYNITGNAIHARVSHANKQIRETKEHLGLHAYKGLLIIANDGIVSFPPAAFVHSTVRLLKHHFSQIDCFIFLTANVFAAIKGVPMPIMFWFPMQMEDPPMIGETFLKSLFISWQNKVSRKTATVPFSHEMKEADMEAFWKARNLPNEVGSKR